MILLGVPLLILLSPILFAQQKLRDSLDKECFSQADKKQLTRNSIKIILNMVLKTTNMTKEEILDDPFQPREEFYGQSQIDCRIKDEKIFK